MSEDFNSNNLCEGNCAASDAFERQGKREITKVLSPSPTRSLDIINRIKVHYLPIKTDFRGVTDVCDNFLPKLLKPCEQQQKHYSPHSYDQNYGTNKSDGIGDSSEENKDFCVSNINGNFVNKSVDDDKCLRDAKEISVKTSFKSEINNNIGISISNIKNTFTDKTTSKVTTVVKNEGTNNLRKGFYSYYTEKDNNNSLFVNRNINGGDDGIFAEVTLRGRRFIGKVIFCRNYNKLICLSECNCDCNRYNCKNSQYNNNDVNVSANNNNINSLDIKNEMIGVVVRLNKHPSFPFWFFSCNRSSENKKRDFCQNAKINDNNKNNRFCYVYKNAMKRQRLNKIDNNDMNYDKESAFDVLSNECNIDHDLRSAMNNKVTHSFGIFNSVCGDDDCDDYTTRMLKMNAVPLVSSLVIPNISCNDSYSFEARPVKKELIEKYRGKMENICYSSKNIDINDQNISSLEELNSLTHILPDYYPTLPCQFDEGNDTIGGSEIQNDICKCDDLSGKIGDANDLNEVIVDSNKIIHRINTSTHSIEKLTEVARDAFYALPKLKISQNNKKKQNIRKEMISDENQKANKEPNADEYNDDESDIKVFETFKYFLHWGSYGNPDVPIWL